jgi:hypothetical protein
MSCKCIAFSAHISILLHTADTTCMSEHMYDKLMTVANMQIHYNHIAVMKTRKRFHCMILVKNTSDKHIFLAKTIHVNISETISSKATIHYTKSV